MIILESLQGKEEQFDFNQLVPMPSKMKDNHDNTIAIALDAPADIDWYSWSVKNWGTKWNAYDVAVFRDENDEGTILITFQTAWSHPRPVIQALSKKFPETDFGLMYADEDWGANYGMYNIKNEEMTVGGGNNPSAVLFARMLHRELPNVPVVATTKKKKRIIVPSTAATAPDEPSNKH